MSVAEMYQGAVTMFEEPFSITATLYPVGMTGYDPVTGVITADPSLRPIDVWGIWAKPADDRTALVGQVSNVTEVRGRDRVFVISPNAKVAPGQESMAQVEVEPKVGDKLTIGAESYSIEAPVNRVMIGNVTINYRLTLKKT